MPIRRPRALLPPIFILALIAAGVAIDPSGNVWLTNNWKNVPIQSNPGGYQIVAYLGLAAPTRSPQIGPPESP